MLRMRAILIIILNIAITNLLFCDMFNPVPITLKDYKLHGKIKKYIIANNQFEEFYYFNELGYIIKYELYYNKSILKTDSNYVYNNNLLVEITTKYYSAESVEKYDYIYDVNNNKLAEIDYYLNYHLFRKYFLKYYDTYYRVDEYKFYVITSYNTRHDFYYILKWENNNLIEYNKYSIKDKLLYTESYKYNENNYISTIVIKEIYNIKNEILIYEYKYDDNKNIIEENAYVRVTDKVKRFLTKTTKSYIYY